MEDYPLTVMDLEKRFSTEEACREYLFRLRLPNGFVCPRCQTPGSWSASRTFYLPDLPLPSLCNRRNDLSGYSQTIDSLVSSRLAHHQQEERSQCDESPTGIGIGKLPDGVDLVTQTPSGYGTSRSRSPKWKVEVDEAYWGAEEEGMIGRQTEHKALIAVAVECSGKKIGRIRLQRIPDTSRESLHGFIKDTIEPGSTVRTDGLNAYLSMEGYTHDRQIQRHQTDGEHLPPNVHQIISLLKRWLLGTHQGAIGHEFLDYYLDEFTFRFHRRTSRS
jgi:hypothetical protein